MAKQSKEKLILELDARQIGYKDVVKQSKEKLIVELDARQIGYKDDMTEQQLSELLKEAKAKEKAKEKAEAIKAEEPLNIDYSGVMCGLKTIQDFHRRLCIIERKLRIKTGN